jgi:hypothetical protein
MRPRQTGGKRLCIRRPGLAQDEGAAAFAQASQIQRALAQKPRRSMQPPHQPVGGQQRLRVGIRHYPALSPAAIWRSTLRAGLAGDQRAGLGQQARCP